IGVARCLAADPQILLMDEPFGAIDPINREEIQNEFLRVQGKLKKTIAFVTHDIHEAIKMGDRIAIFREGKLIQYDRPEVILTRPRNRYIAEFVGADRALKLLGLLRAREAMDGKPVNLLQGRTPAQEALRFLEEKSLNLGVVIEDGKPTGYVTRESLKGEQRTVRELAEPYPVFVGGSDPLKDVMSSLLMYNVPVLCVVDDTGNLAGTITLNSLRRRIMEIYTEEKENRDYSS
ncbi:MAG: CBS domain-containing protein, partial [Syntrophobacteria bacterium]